MMHQSVLGNLHIHIKKVIRPSLLLFVLAVLLIACHSDSSNRSTTKKAVPVALQHLKLAAAENCDDLQAYITDSIIKQYASIPRYLDYYYCPSPINAGGGSGDAGAVPAPAMPEAGSGDSTSGESDGVPSDVSDTNNQELGVHEGDIVKADSLGNIYVLTGRHFIVAKGFPPSEMTELARVDLGGRGLNLFLDKENERVVILARHDEPYYVTTDVPTLTDEMSSVIYPKPESDYTVALFYDVSSPDSPQLLDQLRLQGYFREGRRIDDRLHLVSNHYLRPPNLYEDTEFLNFYHNFLNVIHQVRCEDPDSDIANNPKVQQARQQLVDKIKAIISAADPSEYLPKAFQVTGDTSEEVPYLACPDIHFPQVRMSLGLQIISSVDSNGANLDATGIVNNSYITYASEQNLYLAETSRHWWWLDDEGNWPSSQTAIYKFAISSDAPQYVATGRVDGYALNQFSFSEHNGDLRIATTQDDWIPVTDRPLDWRRVLTNHVTILSDDDSGNLVKQGEVRDFGKEESIRSARFIGDKGFVVTFRNVDPLFTFDLSDPASPSLEGELIIPGFSSYIHPYDDNHLLTIGRAGNEAGTGLGNGMQLQLIDVSDMKNPSVKYAHVPDMPSSWSWSSAEYDHKAFTFYKPANLLAIPLQITPRDSNEYFSGIVAYDVTLENGFEQRGRVDHSDLAWEYYCAGSTELAPDYSLHCGNGWYSQWASPRRSIVMVGSSDTYLYTLSDVGIKASSIADLSTSLGQLIFPLQPYPWWWFHYYPIDMIEPMPAIGMGAPTLVDAGI